MAFCAAYSSPQGTTVTQMLGRSFISSLVGFQQLFPVLNGISNITKRKVRLVIPSLNQGRRMLRMPWDGHGAGTTQTALPCASFPNERRMSPGSSCEHEWGWELREIIAAVPLSMNNHHPSHLLRHRLPCRCQEMRAGNSHHAKERWQGKKNNPHVIKCLK